MSKLISISDLIHQAKLRGINLGSGNPKTHLTYLSEIGLLPGAIRRKSKSSLEGHYPNDILDTLEKIESLKSQGLSYNQIKNQLSSPITPNYELRTANSPLVFLVIGLILGILLARSQSSTPLLNLSSTSPVPVSQTTHLSVVENPSLDNSDQSIYLISIPSQTNLNKIEGVQIK